jgi:hypothetical protein
VFSSKGTSSWTMTPFWRVGRHCNASLKLGDQTLNHFEAETRPWLVNIEVSRQSDALI